LDGYRPGEQETIDRIKQLFRKKPQEDRLSCYKIAKILNKENRPTRQGGQWGDMAHKKFVDDRKWQVKWGYTITGKPYIKDQGWGTSYSKLSKEEYFNQLREQSTVYVV
jgi:hypothetical protein